MRAAFKAGIPGWIALALLLGVGRCQAQGGAELLDLAESSGALKSPAKLTAFLTAHPEAVKAASKYSGYTLLHSAAMDNSTGKFELVQILLDHGADINAPAQQGVTPLREAMRYDRQDMGAFLVSKGAYLDIFSACALKKRERVALLLQENPKHTDERDEYGWTPLWWALESNALDIAELLLAKGADVNAKDAPDPRRSSPIGETPLFRVLSGGRLEQVRFLIRHGADLNVRAVSGSTPLLQCNFYNRQPEIFALLLDSGADPNRGDLYGSTPLHQARAAADVELLIAHGASVHIRDKAGRTPLFACAFPEVTRALVEHGAEVNARADNGMTPIFHSGSRTAAQYLIAHRADVHAVSKEGETPLHTASGGMQPDLVEYLLAQGLKVNAKTHKGWTPLHYAALGGQMPMVQALLAHGADVNAKNDRGETPLQQIAPDTQQGKEIAALLLSKGAKPDLFAAIALDMTDQAAALLKADPRRANARSPQGRTALQIAAEKGRKEIAALLLQYGADAYAPDPFHYGATAIALTRDHKDVQELLQNWQKSHPAPARF